MQMSLTLSSYSLKSRASSERRSFNGKVASIFYWFKHFHSICDANVKREDFVSLPFDFQKPVHGEEVRHCPIGACFGVFRG